MRPASRPRAPDRLSGIALGLVVSSLIRPATASFGMSPAVSWVWPRVGIASWYSARDPGVTPWTANGEPFNDGALTAAMWGVPFDACVQVTNLRTFNRVAVRVNDRGPHERLVAQGRLIDLSSGAFARLAPLDAGLIAVQVAPADPTFCLGPINPS